MPWQTSLRQTFAIHPVKQVGSCLPHAMLSGSNDGGVKSCVRTDLFRINKASRVVAFWYRSGSRNEIK